MPIISVIFHSMNPHLGAAKASERVSSLAGAVCWLAGFFHSAAQLSATPTCDSLMIKISFLYVRVRVYIYMVCAFSARTLFPKNSDSVCVCVCASEKNRRQFYYGLFSRKRNYGNKTHTPRQAPVWRSPPKRLTKEQYKTPHVQCLCTHTLCVWETHIIGYQFDNEAGSEARFSFADCFLGVSRRRAAACHSSCAFHLCALNNHLVVCMRAFLCSFRCWWRD